MRPERNRLVAFVVLALATIAGVPACAGDRLVLPDLDGGGGSDASCTQCGDECVDVKSDPRNCGACGTQCPGSPCNAGTCAPAGACPPTQPDACGMGPMRQCTNFKTDPAHCGNCMTACGMGKVCNNGTCGVACSPLQTTCGTGATATCHTPTGPQDCCGTNCALDRDCTATGCVLCAPKVITLNNNPAPPILSNLYPTCQDSVTNAPIQCPAVKCGRLTFFAFSYGDNRTSFGLVGYDENGGVAKAAVERPGGRYISSITLNANSTATLTGQELAPGVPGTATVSFADFRQ